MKLYANQTKDEQTKRRNVKIQYEMPLEERLKIEKL